MSRVISFKSNDKLMAIKKSNNFGDQIILVIDVSKTNDSTEYAGVCIWSNTESEGCHIPFTEEEILKRMGVNYEC